MSDGSLNPARPLCRTKTNEERLRESIAAATAANEELNVVIAQHSALLANANGELHVLLDQDEHSASDLESIEALKMSVQSRIATFNAMLATQRATIATAESEALSKKQQALQAMTSGDSVTAQRLNNEGARLSLSLFLTPHLVESVLTSSILYTPPPSSTQHLQPVAAAEHSLEGAVALIRTYSDSLGTYEAQLTAARIRIGVINAAQEDAADDEANIQVRITDEQAAIDAGEYINRFSFGTVLHENRILVLLCYT